MNLDFFNHSRQNVRQWFTLIRMKLQHIDAANWDWSKSSDACKNWDDGKQNSFDAPLNEHVDLDNNPQVQIQRLIYCHSSIVIVNTHFLLVFFFNIFCDYII